MRMPEVSQFEEALSQSDPGAAHLLAPDEVSSSALPQHMSTTKSAAAARRWQSATIGFIALIAVWLGY